MSRNQRVVVLGLAVVVLVVAVVVIGTGGSSNSTKDAGPTTIVVQDAKPVGGVKDVTFKKGGTVDLTVKSDTADEVHFHGYDVHKDVAKGGSVVCAGIHMSDIPSFPYDLLWGERVLRSVANLTRRDGEEFLELAPQVPVKTEVETFPLEDANAALDHLRAGEVRGAAVLTPA